MEKKLSIIVPIYNVGRYLRQCIDSILGQSMEEIELILVDDGSTDNSGQICDEYNQRDNRVKVIHQKNQGPIQARWNGLIESQCRYVTFVDGDDFIEQTSYALAAASMKKDIDIIIFGITFYYNSEYQQQAPSDFCAGIYGQEAIQTRILPKVVWNEQDGRCSMSPSLCNKIMKRDLLLSCYERLPSSGFSYGEDNAIFYPMLQIAHSIEIKETSYYNNRCRPKSEVPWYIADAEYFEKLFILYKYLKGFFKDSPEIIRQIEHFYMYSVSVRKRIYGPQKEITHHLFPFNRVKNGEQIVLYGAGAVGQAYMEQIKKLAYCKVVLWADRDYAKYDYLGVSPIERIKTVSYDKIVIAIADKQIKNAVENDLRALGILETQIIK